MFHVWEQYRSYHKHKDNISHACAITSLSPHHIYHLHSAIKYALSLVLVPINTMFKAIVMNNGMCFVIRFGLSSFWAGYILSVIANLIRHMTPSQCGLCWNVLRAERVGWPLRAPEHFRHPSKALR